VNFENTSKNNSELLRKSFFIREEPRKRFLEFIRDFDFSALVSTFQAFKEVTAIHSSLLVLS